MRISIITTVNHNIGDDFVREGILHVLGCAGILKSGDQIKLIHKHSPITSFNGFNAIRSIRASRLLEPLIRTVGVDNWIDKCDVLVQSGAPVYWCHPGGPHCADNEWFDPLVRRNFLRNRRNRPFFNIAGGSCQRYHSDGSEMNDCQKCSAYIKEFFDACDLTILRDDLARKMLNTSGRDASVLPCTSLFARDYFGVRPRSGDYIVLNFMEYGGHYTFGQSIDKRRWRNAFKKIAAEAAKMGRVIVACHNRVELRLAMEVLPGHETFLVPNDHRKFIHFYSGARFGIVNRVHAAFMMASFGKPAVVIGNDSRALMVKNLRLPSFYVDAVQDADVIVDAVRTRESTYREEIEEIRMNARAHYCELILSALETGTNPQG